MTIPKREVLEMLRQLPEDVEVEELIYRLYLREKIAAGDADIAAGRVVPHAEVRKQAASWRK